MEKLYYTAKEVAEMLLSLIHISWLRTQPAMHQVEAENDYDGELRQLSIEAALAVDGKVWRCV